MAITNYFDLFTILVYSCKHFSTQWSFAEYSQRQQCFQVEFPTMLINNVKHVSTNGTIFEIFLTCKVLWLPHSQNIDYYSTILDDKMY